MISFAIGVTAVLIMLQAGVDGPRRAFDECLKQASSSAASQNVSADSYKAHALQACATQADRLKAALVGFDVKNGIRKAQATADADAYVDDVVIGAAQTYRSKTAPR